MDDGVNSDVVRLYTQFAKDTGIRLTFFVNGRYGLWTDHLGMLRPLVDSEQIQLVNHTWPRRGRIVFVSCSPAVLSGYSVHGRIMMSSVFVSLWSRSW